MQPGFDLLPDERHRQIRRMRRFQVALLAGLVVAAEMTTVGAAISFRLYGYSGNLAGFLMLLPGVVPGSERSSRSSRGEDMSSNRSRSLARSCAVPSRSS